MNISCSKQEKRHVYFSNVIYISHECVSDQIGLTDNISNKKNPINFKDTFKNTAKV